MSTRYSTPEERANFIRDIEELPALLERTIEGMSDEQLDTPYREGGWTVRQVVHHVADSHHNSLTRMKLAVTEDHPTVKPYDQDAWAALPDYALPLEPSLALIKGVHAHMTALLKGITDESTWRRTVYHPENGDMTLDDIVRSYAHHGKHHAGQIAALRERNNW